MNHKRKRPKNARAGCLLCKPWKINHASGQEKKVTDRREIERARQQYAELATA